MALRSRVSAWLRTPLLCAGLAVFVFLHSALHAFAADAPRRILLLEGLTPTQPAVLQTMEGFQQRLKQTGARNIEVVTEFLDLGRFRGPEADERFVRFLSARLAQEPVDLIVTISGGATAFMIHNRDKVARGVPLVYCCSPTLAGDGIVIPSDFPGVEMSYDWAGTLALAQRLQPNATSLVLVSGDSDAAHLFVRDALKSLAPWIGKYDTRFLASSRGDELTREVSHLPRNSIVLLMPVFRDRIGSSGFPTEIALDVAKASSAPVYSPVATLFGGGIVGGKMDSYVEQGAKVADLARDVLAGKLAASIPYQTRLAQRFRVDERELKRWGFSEAALPAGTVTEFRAPSLWDTYRYWVLGALLAFAAQAAIIALLLTQKRKRQAAEELLKESEDRMAFAAASTNIGIWQLDLRSGSLWATDHCRAMFGIGVGLPLSWEMFRKAVHPEDRETFDDCLRAPVRYGLPMATEFRVVLPGYNLSWFLCRGHTVSDENGNPLKVTGIFIDVTARKLAESEADLQRMELNHLIRVAALGELSNGLARELSQPLTAIVANAAAVQSLARHDREEVTQVLKEIAEDSARAGQVIHRLRNVLKRGERQSEAVDVNRVVESSLGLLRADLARRKVKVDSALAEHGLRVEGDFAQLQQVIVILITNAIEAMDSTPPAQRTLQICTGSERPGYLDVTVCDNGRGLTANELQNLFRPFFSTKERGLGLGLWICSTIVASHGGCLKVANAPGGGVQALVSLPVPMPTDRPVLVPGEAA